MSRSFTVSERSSHQSLHSSLPTIKKFLLLATASSLALAAEPPANSELVLEDSFDREELGKGWSVNTGEWKIADGILRICEIPADKHSAAARRGLATQNAVYELRFRFTEEGKSFPLGFDPAKGGGIDRIGSAGNCLCRCYL